MAKNLNQLYTESPLETFLSGDLFYVVRGNVDYATTYANLLTAFGSGDSTPWSEITGTPTTLSGYGITDAQPLDSDLTAIAALSTQAYGRSLLTQSSQAAAQETLGVTPGPIYLLFAHNNGTAINKLRVGVSSDGVSFAPIGAELPWTPAVGGIRDPSHFWHEPSQSWVFFYTRATTTITFDTALGLAQTRDFQNFTELPSITPGGLSPAPEYVWGGSAFLDDGNIYFLFLPLGVGGDKETYGAGYIQVENPGDDPSDWTFTDFTRLSTANPNWSAASELNDVSITQMDDGTYRLFCDGDNGTDDPGILTATSNSPLSGYSTLSAVTGLDGREGAILVRRPDGGWRLYSEVIYGAMQQSKSDDLSTWTTPSDIDQRELLSWGNGEVLRIDNLDQQAAILSTVRTTLAIYDGGNNNQLQTLIPSVEWQVFAAAPSTGNGGAGSRYSILTTSSGGLNLNLATFALGGITVYSALAFDQASTAATSRTNLGLGTMATQSANAVAITGGTATFSGAFVAPGAAFTDGVTAANFFAIPGAYVIRNVAATDGAISLEGWASPLSMIRLGGGTTSFPGIKRNGAAVNIRLADDSADAAISAALITSSGGVIFPSSDPLVAGAWWDNAGTLTRSSG